MTISASVSERKAHTVSFSMCHPEGISGVGQKVAGAQPVELINQPDHLLGQCVLAWEMQIELIQGAQTQGCELQ